MLLSQLDEDVAKEWTEVFGHIRDTLTSPDGWLQVGIGAGCVLLAYIIGRVVLRWRGCEGMFHLVFGGPDAEETEQARKPTLPVASVLVTIFLWLMFSILEVTRGGEHCFVLRGLALISTAWLMLIVPSRLLKGRIVPQLLLQFAFAGALLHVTGLLVPVADTLDAVAFKQGSFRLSLKDIVVGIGSICALLWLAGLLSRLSARWISGLSSISVSGRVLLSKIIQMVLYLLAVGIGLRLIGIDLTALAVFSGALGIGIGFGLQKVISNLISGIILLLEKSVKPGDVIRVGDSIGKITALRTRYTSVRTRDHQEHLIPNEDLITGTVVSLSHPTDRTRIKAPVGVAYGADPEKVISVCVEAMESVPRVLGLPKPKLLLRGFGDSAMDYEMRFWIDDPAKGTANIRSEVLLAVHQAFRKADIEMPFPQREVRILSQPASS